MAQLHYQMLDFWEEGDKVRVNLSKRFYLYLDKSDLKAIAPLKVRRNALEFDCPQPRAELRFLTLLNAKMPTLRTLVTNNPAVYVHQHSGIPLIGSISFGLIHRGTSIIEVKPQTSCNLDCTYCSVGEGLSSKQTDYLVERSYLVDEFKRLVEFLGVPVEAHIGVQGEPLVYNEFADLVDDLSRIDEVCQISTDTNGTLLTKPLIDRLAKYPKLRLNISLNTTNQKLASRMAGANYNVPHVMDMIRYAAERMDILVAPLYVPGFNEDEELVKVIEFVKTLRVLSARNSEISEHVKTLPKKDHPMIGIQNFMNYSTGRSPTKPIGWDAFIVKLRTLEKRTGERLVLDFKKDFKITQTKQLPKPFRKGQTVTARVVALGRYPKTRLAVAKERAITIVSSDAAMGKDVKLRILRSKHNIFFAKEI